MDAAVTQWRRDIKFALPLERVKKDERHAVPNAQCRRLFITGDRGDRRLSENAHAEDAEFYVAAPLPLPPHPSRHPIRHHQPRHARELAAVCRHQSGAAARAWAAMRQSRGRWACLALQIMRGLSPAVRGVFGHRMEVPRSPARETRQQAIGFGPPSLRAWP